MTDCNGACAGCLLKLAYRISDARAQQFGGEIVVKRKEFFVVRVAVPLASFACLCLVIALFQGSFANAQPDNSRETLTNAAVVKMVQAHFGADIIIEHIRTHPGKFDLDTDALIRLKQLGVPDKVISAMQARSGASTASAISSAAAKTPSSDVCGGNAGKWVQQTANRGLNGSQQQLLLCEPFNGGRDHAEVTVTCSVDLTFQLSYFPDNKDVTLALSAPSSTVTSIGGSTLGMATATGQVTPNARRVQLRYKMDNLPIVTITPIAEYTNAVKFTFGGDPKSNPMMALGTTKAEVYKARDLRIELPLSNGETPVINIKPQDPSFLKFTSLCTGSTKSTEAGPTFTADEFAREVATSLRKAATDHGLGPSGYDKEIDYVASAVKTCAGISPAMATHGAIIGRTYGEKYLICQGMDAAKHNYRPFHTVGWLEDASWVTNNPHPAQPNRPDNVLFVIFQPGENLSLGGRKPEVRGWNEGKGFNVSVAIASDNDALLWNVHIDRDVNAPEPVPISASSQPSKAAGTPPAPRPRH